jgi:para-aminobenzoate synthetase/4-amino-4-deoxychorismate lyase
VHLEDLRKQAEDAGFKFDHHAARNELQAATFGKRTASTARLVLSPTGAMAIEVRPA